MGEFTRAASGILQAGASITAGREADVETRIRARQEKDAAMARDNDRRSRLVRALSSQIAARGAQGIDMGFGSAQAIARADMAEADLDQLTGRVNLERRTAQLRRMGRQARRAGVIQAGSALLDTATDISQMRRR